MNQLQNLQQQEQMILNKINLIHQDDKNQLLQKDKENQALLVINKKLLDDVEYYRISNFNSYVEQVNKFIFNIYNNINKYIPKRITESKFYKLIHSEYINRLFNNLLKVFPFNPIDYILIIYQKFILPLLIISLFLSKYIVYRKLENLVLNFLTIIFFVYYINYTSDFSLIYIKV